jgi:hypothetical protein
MKLLFLTMTAVSAAAMAAPAAAQYYPSQNNYPPPGNYPYDTRADMRTDFDARFDQRLDRLEERLEAGIDAGAIDRREARSLRLQIRSLTRLERRYAYDGFSQQEQMDLMQRLRSLRQDLRLADNGLGDRDRRYGANDRYDDDRYDNDNGYSGRGGPYDADGDGWDDRDCDRDGDIDSGSCVSGSGSTGVRGIIDTLLGTGGLQVGQRVSGNLYGIPSEYRDRYRDDYRYYYRSDGRRIYQIDAQTNVVVRVYPM